MEKVHELVERLAGAESGTEVKLYMQAPGASGLHPAWREAGEVDGSGSSISQEPRRRLRRIGREPSRSFYREGGHVLAYEAQRGRARGRRHRRYPE